MFCLTTFMPKTLCAAAADASAVSASACSFFRIIMDAALCAGSIFAVLAFLGAVAGIVVPVVWLVGIGILAIGVSNRSVTARRAF